MDKNSLDKRYVFLTIILLILGSGLLVLPKFKVHEGIKPSMLLQKISSPERYITSDDLANRIISNDPSFLLIDVRPTSDYEKYSLPNAIHIPLEKLFDDASENYLNQDQYNVILYSNDHYSADQAWTLCQRMDYSNLYVLKGGMNEWYHTIINPKKPTEQMPQIAFDTYSFRKAASMYFGVGYDEPTYAAPSKKKVVVKKPLKKIVPIKKKKKYESEGGC
ncbi:MAG: hypothetical protein COB60_00860 [Flavobacteriaceae bacterium]|nr:MAG: hypothetical protein COB60_00860 [Flavobacteriaceae bacterium]